MRTIARCVGVVLSGLLLACTDAAGPSSSATPVGRPTTRLAQPSRHMVSEVKVAFTVEGADSVRAHYTTIDGSDSGVSPWVADQRGVVPLLGLRASTSYLLWTEAKRGTVMAVGDTVSYVTGALPSALLDAHLEIQEGGPLSGGYTLTSTEGDDGDFYAVAYDSVGVLVVEAIAQAGGALLLTEIPDRGDKLMVFTGIDSAKFRRPIVPGDQLRIEVTVLNWRSRAVRMQGIVTVDGKVACEAIVMCQLVPRAAKKPEATAE